MKNPEFLIIGSGPGGTAAALKLIRVGRRVLMLERGDFLPKEEENRSSEAVYGEKKYRTAERWIDKDGEPFQPWMHYFVGGNAKLYGAALYRFRRADFGELSYSDGVSPAWPISYDDLAPYYDEAEVLYSVHGERAADASEPTSRPYPLPPLEDEEVIMKVKRQLAESGVSSLPLPLGVDLKESSGDWKCDLAHFDAYPDPALAKGEPEACALDELRAAGDRFCLRTGCFVERFLYKGDTVTGVEATVDGGKVVLAAQHYICAAGAINSAALFLRSGGDFANSSGLVGRNYMAHVCTTAVATFDQAHDTTFAKTFGTNHWYQPDSGGALYGSIQTQGKWDAVQYGLEEWSLGEGDDAEDIAQRSIELFFMTEDLPLKENRVEVDEDGTIHLIQNATGDAEHEALVDALKSALEVGGEMELQTFRKQRLPVAWCTHQCGTLCFGTDRSLSVLDIWCRCHDVQNVTVLDASFFPSSTALNPTLTIVANALRVGEHLSGKIF